MKQYFLPALKMTLVMLVLCCGISFGIVTLIGLAAPGSGKGVTLTHNGRVVGYERVGQKFTEDKYFWGRPSAVEYNAAGSAGSNKGPSNPDYLKIVQDRIDTFLAHNPGVSKGQIPADLVTASGSGLDPHISPAGAYIQVSRIARVRGIDEASVNALVNAQISRNPLGPDVVHVLKLNIALDNLDKD